MSLEEAGGRIYVYSFICRQRKIFLFWGFILLAFLPSWWTGFVWDDVQYILQNPDLRTSQGLFRIWFVPSSSPQYYPLTFSTFWIEYQLWGLDPAGYKLVNLILHGANAFLLWTLIDTCLGVKRCWVGFFTALLFAIHPLRVESVAWISERKDVLSGFFALLSAKFWIANIALSPAERGWRFLFPFSAALLSKTAVCPLPLALVVMDHWRHREAWRKSWAAAAPGLVLAFFAGMLHLFLEQSNIDSARKMLDIPVLERILIAGHAFWFYVLKTIWPFPLMTLYPRWQFDPMQATLWLVPVSVFLVMLLAWFHQRKDHGFALLCVGIYSVLLFPASGLLLQAFNRFSYVADHFIYLAGIGLVLPLGVLLQHLVQQKRTVWLPWLILTLLAMGSFVRGLDYKDSETLFRQNLKYNPTSWGVHNALGSVELTQKSNPGAAIAHFQAAIQLEPQAAQAYYNLGVALTQAGKAAEAEEAYRYCLGIVPGYAEAWNNLGILYANLGRIEQAREAFLRAIEQKPGNQEFQGNLREAERLLRER